jgi:hypothetical protein
MAPVADARRFSESLSVAMLDARSQVNAVIVASPIISTISLPSTLKGLMGWVDIDHYIIFIQFHPDSSARF